MFFLSSLILCYVSILMMCVIIYFDDVTREAKIARLFYGISNKHILDAYTNY